MYVESYLKQLSESNHFALIKNKIKILETIDK